MTKLIIMRTTAELAFLLSKDLPRAHVDAVRFDKMVTDFNKGEQVSLDDSGDIHYSLLEI